jgi:hypothetical protein
VFGCRAFVHIPRDEKSKLDSKSSNVSSWFMGTKSLVIDCRIQLLRNSYEAKMSSSLKIKSLKTWIRKRHSLSVNTMFIWIKLFLFV